jgi:hypothetical protein
MLKIISDSFKITNKFLVLATPLIFFSLLSSLYLIFSGNNGIISSIITFVLFFLMLSAFLSGWLYMVAKAVKDPDSENADALIMDFPAGVGEYFLIIPCVIINICIVSIILTVIACILGVKFIGNPNVSYEQIYNAMTTITAMKEFAASLTHEQLVKIEAWNLLLFGTTTVISFINMFYSPAVLFKKKNPFVAYWVCFRDLFSYRFLNNVVLFLFIIVLHTIISMFAMFLSTNVILYFIFTLIKFYFVTYIAVLVFNYYYSNFVKIGSKVDKMV